MNKFLYCENGLYVAAIAIIDDKIVKYSNLDCNFDNPLNYNDKVDEINNLIDDKNYKGVIVIQNDNVQNYYGDKETLKHLKEIFKMLPGNAKRIKEGIINFNYK